MPCSLLQSSATCSHAPFPALGFAAYICTTSTQPPTKYHWVFSVPDRPHLASRISPSRFFLVGSHYPSVEQLHLPGRSFFRIYLLPSTVLSFVYSHSVVVARRFSSSCITVTVTVSAPRFECIPILISDMSTKEAAHQRSYMVLRLTKRFVSARSTVNLSARDLIQQTTNRLSAISLFRIFRLDFDQGKVFIHDYSNREKK